jgi:hypothetical protein
VFIFTIISGYLLLFERTPVFGVAAGAVLAISAWGFARWIGGSDGGIRSHIPLFVGLLVISAVGVMNFLFLNLEGRPVFAETIAASQDSFGLLATRAEQKLTADHVIARRDSVQGLTDALIREIDNPLNCGQGEHARDIMRQLKELLPRFEPLSSTGVNCKHNADVVASYKERIAGLLDAAPWNNPELASVVTIADANKARLQKLDNDVEGLSAYGLLGTVKPALKDVDLAYRTAYEHLARQGGNVDGVARGLPLATVDGLGEWSQLLGLIIGRLDRPSTYVYIALAVGFDWFMVYLFRLVRLSRAGREASFQRVVATERAW